MGAAGLVARAEVLSTGRTPAPPSALLEASLRQAAQGQDGAGGRAVAMKWECWACCSLSACSRCMALKPGPLELEVGEAMEGSWSWRPLAGPGGARWLGWGGAGQGRLEGRLREVAGGKQVAEVHGGVPGPGMHWKPLGAGEAGGGARRHAGVRWSW